MNRFRASRPTRRGGTLVLVALLIGFIVALCALAIDLGYLMLVRTELQCAADAAALAAVVDIPDDGAVETAALRYASINTGDSEVLLASDVETGAWDRETATFNVAPAAVADAVRVRVRRCEARGNEVSLFFATVMGRESVDLEAVAVACVRRGLCGPLIGVDSIDMAGTPTTDSYKSSQGPYGTAEIGRNGNLCSDGPIDVVGAATVNGSANPGKGYQTSVSGAASVTGNTDPRNRPLNLPAVDASDAEAANDNANLPLTDGPGPPRSVVDADGNFTLSARTTYSMPAGTYHFRDFRLTGQATLNIDGPTTIYVTGNLDTAGGAIANATFVPNNLKILMTGEDGSTATIVGNANFHGAIYAPEVDVTIVGTGQIFGACVGKTLTIRGTGDVHYDENLDLSDVLRLQPQAYLVQ